MNIYIGSDHAGFELKEFLKAPLSEMGHIVVDCGAYSLDTQDDYPPYIGKVAKAISEAEAVKLSEEISADKKHKTVGIVIGGSGQGEAIVANKFPHVRATLCYGGAEAENIVRLAREHNNANVLSLGARFLPHDQALELVIEWLNTDFSGDERHVRRLHEIENINQYQNLYE